MQENNLVHVKRNEILTDTVLIAEMLEVKHAFLLRTVENLVERQKNNKDLNISQKFIECTFKNKMNRSYKMFKLNEPAYMKLVMHLKGYEKAEIIQDKIIESYSGVFIQ